MIEVIQAGQFTTIQDLGRFGFRSMGVPISGPMDRYSSRLANELLGNDENAPVLEMTFTGATLLFHEAATIVITGANCRVSGAEEEIEHNRVIPIKANTQLKFGAITDGNFMYLAIHGGFIFDEILGSVSHFKGITSESKIEKGHVLRFAQTNKKLELKGVKFNPQKLTGSDLIQVEKGPEFHLLSESDIQVLENSIFSISTQSNRMGFRLKKQVSIDVQEIISSPVQPGTVQLTPGGQLIALMRDAQTTGGYARIFQLTPSSINQLAQKPFGEDFKFQFID